MKHFSYPAGIILLLLVIMTVGLWPSPALAQYGEQAVMTANSIAAATPEYGPDGTASSDSAWILSNPTDPLSPITLFICPDSVSGYGTADDTIKVQVLYESKNVTTVAYPANYTTQILFYRDCALGSVPSDTCYYATFTPPPHYRRRYLVSVDDDISVTLTEATNNAVYHNPWRP